MTYTTRFPLSPQQTQPKTVTTPVKNRYRLPCAPHTTLLTPQKKASLAFSVCRFIFPFSILENDGELDDL